jgi:uncharacterized protein
MSMSTTSNPIPTQSQCFALIREMAVLDHIVDHSLLVCRVACLLADQLKLVGVSLNRELVRAAALLHDITKTRSFETGENHAVTGAQLLTERGYPAVASVVGQHVALDAFDLSAPPGEAEIVNYADKRVLHDQLVSLDVRMQYIMERYGCNQQARQRIDRLWQRTRELETRLFQRLPFAPGEVKDLMGADECGCEEASPVHRSEDVANDGVRRHQ